MEKHTWHYFLALENDLVRTTEFVEPSERNFNTFSNWYAKLLLLVGSEIDVVAKQLCATLSNTTAPANIKQYCDVITTEFPKLHEFEMGVPRYSLSFKPWSSWGASEKCSPQWWKDYNSVKHERNSNFEKANLGNVLNAFAGLLILELYYYRTKLTLQPIPKLFNAGFPDNVVVGGSLLLPDVH